MGFIHMFKIGARNVWRYKIRTIFTVLALGVGIGITIANFSIMRGFYEQAFDAIIAEETGHIQVRKALYDKEQLRQPVSSNYSLGQVHQLSQAVAQTKNKAVTAVGSYIVFNATILANQHAVTVNGKGIDPFESPFLDTTIRLIKKGSFFPPNNGIAFGSSHLFKQLHVQDLEYKASIVYKDYQGNDATFPLIIQLDPAIQTDSPMLRIPEGLVRAFPWGTVSEEVRNRTTQDFTLTIRTDQEIVHSYTPPESLGPHAPMYLDITVQTQLIPVRAITDPIYQKLEASTRLKNPMATIILGDTLAETLEVTVGDMVRVRATDAHGMIAADTFTVIGILHANFSILDASTIFIPLAEAQRFLQMEDQATFLKIMLGGRKDVDTYLDTIRRSLDTQGYPIGPPLDTLFDKNESKDTDAFKQLPPHALSVEPWTYYARAIVVANEIDQVSNGVMVMLIVFLVIFGVMNTMTLSVRQRSLELSTLRAMGMHRKEVVYIILSESVLLGMIGTMVGLGIGWVVSYLLENYGLAFPADVTENIFRGIEPVIKGDTQVQDYLIAGSLGIVAGLLGSIFPSRFVTRMSIIHGLQQKPEVEIEKRS